MSAKRVVLIVSACAIALVCLCGCPRVPMLRSIFEQANFSDDGYISYLPEDNPTPQPQVADQFTLSEGMSTIKLIQWWGTQDTGITDPDNFIIRIYEDNGTGQPEETPLYSIPVGAATREDTGEDAKPGMGSPPIYRYSVEFIPFDLEPGVPYYLSIVNNVENVWVWMWTTDIEGEAPTFARAGDEGPWTDPLSYDVAFRLWQ